MDLRLKVGDIAETVDDDIKGEVISIYADKIILKTQDGFEMPFSPNELIKSPDDDLPIKFQDLYKAKQAELNNIPKKTSKKSEPITRLEVDLHIHELIDDARRLSNYEILNIQMDHAKKRLEWAMQKKLKAVVFIHGVGEGVLRAELHTLFRRYENLEYFDANYQTYGVGATEVRIY
jgi:dsDNA-specific endonuclease/ATPase MutS2